MVEAGPESSYATVWSNKTDETGTVSWSMSTGSAGGIHSDGVDVLRVEEPRQVGDR
jgi:hypothetical protein